MLKNKGVDTFEYRIDLRRFKMKLSFYVTVWPNNLLSNGEIDPNNLPSIEFKPTSFTPPPESKRYKIDVDLPNPFMSSTTFRTIEVKTEGV